MKYRILSKMNTVGDILYYPQYKNILGFWCNFTDVCINPDLGSCELFYIKLCKAYNYIDSLVDVENYGIKIHKYPENINEKI